MMYESYLILMKKSIYVIWVCLFVLPLDLISSCLCSVLAFVLVGVHISLFLGLQTLRDFVGAAISVLLARFHFPAALLRSWVNVLTGVWFGSGLPAQVWSGVRPRAKDSRSARPGVARLRFWSVTSPILLRSSVRFVVPARSLLPLQIFLTLNHFRSC
jgi:hypothetical protein